MKIEFIIPTFSRPDALACLLYSLKAQTVPDWTAHVVADCPPKETIKALERLCTGDERIKLTIINHRANDYGHTPRNTGLASATGDFVCMTGEDNYYVPTFVEEVIHAVTPETNFIYCDMVHNWGKDYIYVPSLIFWSHIDIGNSVYRTEYAKQLRLNTSNFSADWEFTQAYLKKFSGKVTHIQKCLYVHN